MSRSAQTRVDDIPVLVARPSIIDRVLGRFRAEMWPILGHTVLDAIRVID